MENIHIIDFMSTVFEILALVYLQFGRTERLDKKIKRNTVLYFSIMVASVYGMTLLQVSIILKSMGVILLTAVIGTRVEKRSIKYGTVIGTLFMMAVVISEVITMALLNFVMYFTRNIYQTSYFQTLATFLSKFILIFLCLIIKKFLDKTIRKTNFGNWMIIILPNLFHLFLLLMIGYRMYNNGGVDGSETALLLFIAVMLLISTLCNIITSEYYLEMKEIEHNSKMNMAQLQMQYEYYRSKQEDELKVRELYHDMKNHLLILQNNLETEQKEMYINNMLREIKGVESYIETGNDFLNCIINEKYKEAVSKGIDFQTVIDFSEITFMNPMDICIIFSNAIDNAIEGCEKIEIPEQKILTVKAKKVRNFLIIAFENTSTKVLVIENQTIKTTKADKNLHGFGLNNIKKTVEKYQGECKIKKEMEQFILYLVIPCIS